MGKGVRRKECSFIRLSVCSFILYLVCPYTRMPVCSFTRSPICVVSYASAWRLAIGINFAKIAVYFFILLCFPIFFPCVGRADEFKLTPLIAVKAEHNDNILFTSTDAQKDSIKVFSPGLSLLEKTERMEINLSGRADRRLYSKYSELNSTDQFYDGTGRYLLTERFNVSGKVNYVQDSNPARDLETTGFAFTGVTRYRQNYGFGSNYMLSELLLTTFSYDYLNDKFNDPRYTDNESHVFNAGLIHDLSYFMQKTQARMNIGYARYNIPDLHVDNYEWTAGVNRALNEKWNIQLDAGLRHTRSRFSFSDAAPSPTFFVKRYDNSEDWGGVGQLALTYNAPKSNGEVKISQDIMPASGQSGTTDRTSFAFGLNVWLAYEFRWILNGGYIINKSRSGEYSVQKIDQDNIWIRPAIIYDYSKDTSIDFSYTFNKIRYNTNNTDAEQNLFQIRFRVQHDLFN